MRTSDATDWPWCEACRSRHHPDNPTCKLRLPVSEPWETQPGWEGEVAAPVNRHMLAPREARALLEHAGLLADLGIPVAAMLDAIMSLVAPLAPPEGP